VVVELRRLMDPVQAAAGLGYLVKELAGRLVLCPVVQVMAAAVDLLVLQGQVLTRQHTLLETAARMVGVVAELRDRICWVLLLPEHPGPFA